MTEISMQVNGYSYTGHVEPRRTLADFLRKDCGLAGVRLGCEHGVCGACTIEVNGRTARSCLQFAVRVDGAAVTTVEGMADGDRLHPLQQALWDLHGVQCGFCTSGIVMTMTEFLRDRPDPTEAEVREALSGNLCRCTGYHNIVRAVLRAAAVMRGAAPGQEPADIASVDPQ